MKTKLTLVSIFSNGHKTSRFVNARIINGKAVISGDAIEQMAKELHLRRGDTLSIG